MPTEPGRTFLRVRLPRSRMPTCAYPSRRCGLGNGGGRQSTWCGWSADGKDGTSYGLYHVVTATMSYGLYHVVRAIPCRTGYTMSYGLYHVVTATMSLRAIPCRYGLSCRYGWWADRKGTSTQARVHRPRSALVSRDAHAGGVYVAGMRSGVLGMNQRYDQEQTAMSKPSAR